MILPPISAPITGNASKGSPHHADFFAHNAIKNGSVIVGPNSEIQQVDILISDSIIKKISKEISLLEAKEHSSEVTIINATDKLVSPGFIQTHLHFCQTLFRCSADDLELLDWLRLRI